MQPRRLYLAGALAIAALLAAWLLLANRTVTLVLDGQRQTLTTRAWTVAGALQSAGIAVSTADRLEPVAGALLLGSPEIRLERARSVRIYPAGGAPLDLLTTGRTPADWLAEAGIAPAETDRIYLNGQPVDPQSEQPALPAYTLQIDPAVAVEIDSGGAAQEIRSPAATLGEALWEAGIELTTADRLSLPPATPLTGDLAVSLVAARPLEITLPDGLVTGATSAETVGQALAENGIALQGLDYSLPAETEPLPADGKIQVVRVREEILLDQVPIPYEKEFQPDAEVELDQRAVTQPGEFGLEVSQVRVRYEDGQEVARSEEARWVAKEPKNEIVGYGTKVVVKTLDTPDGPIEYWRAVNVYATSYSPCRSAADRCYPGTSSGLPVQHGVIGVTRAWYNQFVGQKLYVPGYGTGVIADTGGGVPGEYWIDLGFSDADFVPWHSYVTVYFLTPVPANIPWILP